MSTAKIRYTVNDPHSGFPYNEAMANVDSNDELRDAIKKAGVAEVARTAGLKPTTLYSYCSGATANLRSDTRAAVLDALATLTGESSGDNSLAETISIWDHIPDARRQALAETARAFAEKGSRKK